MSRAATATPPPPYFPQRTSTPTMRHCANPGVNASHFAPRQPAFHPSSSSIPLASSASNSGSKQQLSEEMHQSQSQLPSGQRRKIKHLPSSLGGLRRKSTSAKGKRDVEVEREQDDLNSGMNDTRSMREDDRSSFGSLRSSRSGHSGRSGRTDRSGGSLPSIDSDSFTSTSSVDSTTLPTPTTATGSFVLQQYPDLDTAELEHAFASRSFSDYNGNVYKHSAGDDDVDVSMDAITPTATPTNGNGGAGTPNRDNQGNGSKSWVPHFAFGQLQLARARAAVSTGFASFGEKKRKDASVASAAAGQGLTIDTAGAAASLPGVPPPRPFALPFPVPMQRIDSGAGLDLDLDLDVGFNAQAQMSAAVETPLRIVPEEVLRADAQFRPMAEMTAPPPDTLAGLAPEEQERRKLEWQHAQRARLAQCAQLCSQWPLSGYHLSKFGPNGARHCYEPQSFSNPAHVANLMQRQAELEWTMCRDSSLHFFAASFQQKRLQEQLQYREADTQSSPPSPTISDEQDDAYALRTAREIRRAMASDLLSISANSSQVSLSLVPGSQDSVRPVLVKRKTGARQAHLNELNGFAASMALDQLDVRASAQSSGDIDVDDGDTDTTSLAPSLSSLRSSLDLRESRDLSYPSRTISGPGYNRPSAQSLFVTRPSRAQSCGSKRPPSDLISGTGTRARASRDEDGEKRRKVVDDASMAEAEAKADEAMVLEEAVSSGVIMPQEGACNLEAAEEEMSGEATERMCASTPNLGSLRSRSGVDSHGVPTRQYIQQQQPQQLPLAAPSKMAFDASGNAHSHAYAQPRGFTAAPPAPGCAPNGNGHGASAAVFGHVVKTSDTHPIIISPFFPDELLPVLTKHLVLPSAPSALTSAFVRREGEGQGQDKKVLRMYSEIDVVSTLLSYVPSVPPSPVNCDSGSNGTYGTLQMVEQQQTPRPPSAQQAHMSVVRSPLPWSSFGACSTETSVPNASHPSGLGRPQQLGNLLLSSCPGKRLRMDGPVNGRGPVCRDLKTDLERIKGEGVGCLVCCLDDAELALLGVPWETYRDVANEIGLDIIRLPMPDGFTPVSISLFDAQISLIATRYTLRGINVLVHCRGGVGRAGLTACAWAIKMGYVQPHPSLVVVEQRAIEQARERELAAQARVQQQQQQRQSQGQGSSGKTYKGFSLFPRSSSSSSNVCMDRAASVPASGNLSGAGNAAATSQSVDPAFTAGSASAEPAAPIIPPELEHQIVMSTVERVIAMIRARRGMKAIESFEQVQFLVEYVRWLRAGGR